MLRKKIKKIICKLGLARVFFPDRFKRIHLANKYLTGAGAEIGALHNPLKLPRDTTAKYIDIATREESIEKFPELEAKDIVHVDYITDGFTLNEVPSDLFDFLIANHVLEHSPNPIGALIQWIRVIKPGGILYCTIPLMHKCFDKGRQVTPIDHLIEDFEMFTRGHLAILADRNKTHYREWLTISEPAMLKQPAQPNFQINNLINEMAEKGVEIHFHTFTLQSTKDLFSRLAVNILYGIRVMEILETYREVIVVIKK